MFYEYRTIMEIVIQSTFSKCTTKVYQALLQQGEIAAAAVVSFSPVKEV